MNRLLLALAGILCCLAATPFTRAQLPQLINYQGRVVVGGTNFTGTGQFKFAFVSGSGTTTYWSNDGTGSGGGQPTSAVSLNVTSGLYQLALGDTTLANMTVIPPGVFGNADVRLRVWFNDGTDGWQQLVPDQRITAVGYAITSGSAAQSGTAGFALSSGSAQQSGTAAYALNAGSVLLSSSSGFASQSGTSAYSLTSGTAGALAPVLLLSGSNVEYVMIGGNDATALRGDIGHPFATGSAALAVAQPGDVMQFGPGLFQGFLNVSVNNLWIRGSGAGEFAPDDSQIIGGTRFYAFSPVSSVIGAYTTGTLTGERFSDFAVDTGPAVTGSGTINGYAGAIFIIGSMANTAAGMNDFQVSNVNLLGAGGIGTEGLTLQSGSNYSVQNVEIHRVGDGVVDKSCWGTFRNIKGVNCPVETIIVKSGGVGNGGYSASHNTFEGIEAVGTVGGVAIVLDDFGPNNNPPLSAISITNGHSSQGPLGQFIALAESGTAFPMSGIEVSNCVSDGEYSFDNVTYNGTQPILAHFSNCTAQFSAHSGFTVNGQWTMSNCTATGCYNGYELFVSAPDQYADLIDCVANNCARTVQTDTPQVYLLRHPIISTGTGGGFSPNTAGAQICGFPLLWHSQPGYGVTVANTTAQLSIWGGSNGFNWSASALWTIPQPMLLHSLRITTKGTYTVASTGSSTLTFVPAWPASNSGGAFSINNAITASLPAGSSGAWVLTREFTDRNPTDYPYAVGTWYNTLQIGGQFLYSSATYAPLSITSDIQPDEQVYWSTSSTANTVTSQGATIEVLDDPVSGD